jgi:uncharacterized protein
MNSALPESVDAWRMVQARRTFHGTLPLAALSRLRDSLATSEGVVAYDLEFGKDDIGVALLRVRADTSLPLVCQRTLEPFGLAVHVDARLGLIAREADEASLPAGYEPLLTTDGQLHLADVIEDELILALPVVPLKPGVAEAAHAWREQEHQEQHEQDETHANPFAVLQKIKVAKR